MLESGLLNDVGDRFSIAGPLPLLAIPTSLNASLLARLDRLAPVREVAQIAAALGRSFSYDLISAVAAITPKQLDESLARLQESGLIYRRGSPPHAEYTFKHALVQDTAYGTLLHSRRQELHQRIAITLEAQFTETIESQPDVLARHCTEAGLVEKAIGYRLKAGQQSISKWAMREAVSQLRKGIDLLPGVSALRTRLEQELDLQLAFGQALLATSGYSAPEPGEAYSRARYLCEELDRPTQLGPVLYGQFVFRLVRGELTQAEHHATEMRQLGEARNDVIWKCLGERVSGVICCVLGKFSAARMHSDTALSLWDSAYRSAAAAPADPHVSTLLYLSRSLFCLGYADQARLRRDEALTEARQLSPFTLAYGLYVAWASYWALEGTNAASTVLCSADEVLAISSEQGFPLLLGFGKIMRGWSLSALGNPNEGITLFLQGLETYRATGAKLALPFVLTTLAEMYARAGLVKEGLDRLAEAEDVTVMTQECWAEAEIHRLRGRLISKGHQHSAAENSYQRALAVAESQGAKFWQLRAAASLALLWRDQGKGAAGRDLLLPVYKSFSEGFETPTLRKAKELLHQLL